MKTNMKRVVGMSVLMVIVFATGIKAQNKTATIRRDTLRFELPKDDQRMMRDMEVAESVLSTLVKQQTNIRGYFQSMDVTGDYIPGYGVTFKLPDDHRIATMLMTLNSKQNPSIYKNNYGQTMTIVDGAVVTEEPSLKAKQDLATKGITITTTKNPSTKLIEVKTNVQDSARTAYNERLIEASKNFIADYGDLISQMTPEERIRITNQEDRQTSLYMNNNSKRAYISIEATRGDINKLRQGKLTREQFMSTIQIVNTETTSEINPDLELFSSILSRLYQQDLSKTYITQRDVYYERLKDFGVIYYMQTLSSYLSANGRNNMPTIRLSDLDQKTRDAKVKELYPQFEKEIKENLLDYGRTLRSLKDDESLILNIKLTKCEGCGIPSTLELSTKELILKDYNAGKLTKEAALGKISVKKGANQ